MNTANQAGKILWALDPLGNKAQQLKSLSTLKALTKGSGQTIEPIAVLSPDQLRIPMEAFGKHHAQYRLKADKVLKSWLKGSGLPNLLPPTLLASEDYSNRGSVQTLLAYAKESKVGLIAINTRSKKGLLKYTLGSFAEDLLLHSDIPLLIINSHSKVSTKIREIFLPTDLNPSSDLAFKKVLVLAKAMGAKLVLFHKLDYVAPETYNMLYQVPVYDSYFQADTDSRRKKLQSLVDEAKKAGVKATFVFDEKPSFVADSVLKQSKKMKSGMIAMASHTGPLASVMLGSIARQVLRQTRCPAWVIHTK